MTDQTSGPAPGHTGPGHPAPTPSEPVHAVPAPSEQATSEQGQTPEQDGAALLKRRGHYTADLLLSLQDSIHRLRKEAEELREQLETTGADEMTGAKSQVRKLEDLIRDCQKVEKTLAEQSTDVARLLKSEHELDLVAARAAVELGLSRLRAALAPELLLG
ncbi:hypothetical protein [Leisingera sp. ANG-DT]|uniref:hypothetical protein n=1 Tax=Leisingera sp. ANG-DT TaxID=1577897 RepID=UPI000AFA29BC|nr:hypothetical protein [Leisingera sp. ANG-DT]